MRTIGAQLEAVLTSEAGYGAHARVLVDSDGGGTMIDLTDYLEWDWVNAVTINEHVDQQFARASVTLAKRRGSISLASLMASSQPNFSNTLIDIGRLIVIETATIATGYTPTASDWQTQFRGRIQVLDTAGNSIKLDCLDDEHRLLTTFIETNNVYGTAGGQAVQTAMQNILTAHLASAPTLYTPTSPSWNILEYKQQREPVANAIRKLANQIGWDVRYRWDNGTNAFRLTLYSPDRAPASADRTFGPDQYYTPTKSAISLSMPRNKIQVVYTDASTGRTTYTAQDATSQTRFGVLFMQIAEDATSLIDSSSEAQNLADRILADLKDPTLDYSIPMPFFGAAQLGDYYAFSANDEDFDTTTNLGVVGITHSFDANGNARTVLDTRGKPSAGVLRWFEIEGRPGVAPAADIYSDGAPSGVTAVPDSGSIKVSFDDPRAAAPPMSDWAYTVCYMHTSSGFTPGPAYEIARGRQTSFTVTGLTLGQTYYIKLIHYDESGNASATSTQISEAVPYVGPANLTQDAYYALVIRNPTLSAFFQDDQNAAPPEAWRITNESNIFSSVSGSAASASWASTGNATIWYGGTTLSGQSSARFNPYSSTPGSDQVWSLVSDLAPVREGDILRVVTYVRRSSGDASKMRAAAALRFYQNDRSTLVSTARTLELAGDASGTTWTVISFDTYAASTAAWYYSIAYVVVPAGAAYAKGILQKWRDNVAGGDTYIYFDSFDVRKVRDYWEAYTASHSIATGGWVPQSTGNTAEDRSGSGSSTGWTAPKDMKVRIFAQNRCSSLTVGKALAVRVQLNGTVITGGVGGPNVRNAMSAETGAAVKCASVSVVAGDVIRMQSLHNEGLNVTVEESICVEELEE